MRPVAMPILSPRPPPVHSKPTTMYCRRRNDALDPALLADAFTVLYSVVSVARPRLDGGWHAPHDHAVTWRCLEPSRGFGESDRGPNCCHVRFPAVPWSVLLFILPSYTTCRTTL